MNFGSIFNMSEFRVFDHDQKTSLGLDETGFNNRTLSALSFPVEKEKSINILTNFKKINKKNKYKTSPKTQQIKVLHQFFRKK